MKDYSRRHDAQTIKWGKHTPEHTKIEKNLKTLGLNKKYDIYFHPEVTKRYNSSLSKRVKNKLNIFLIYLAYDAQDVLPNSFQKTSITPNKHYLTQLDMFHVLWTFKSGHILILDI